MKDDCLITDAAHRLGRNFALACARAGADIIIHHAHSEEDAESARDEIVGLGRKTWVFQADLGDSSQANGLMPLVNQSVTQDGLVNNAMVFESFSFVVTSLFS